MELASEPTIVSERLVLVVSSTRTRTATLRPDCPQKIVCRMLDARSGSLSVTTKRVRHSRRDDERDTRLRLCLETRTSLSSDRKIGYSPDISDIQNKTRGVLFFRYERRENTNIAGGERGRSGEEHRKKKHALITCTAMPSICVWILDYSIDF